MVCFMVFAGVCWHRGVAANGAPMPLTAFGELSGPQTTPHPWPDYATTPLLQLAVKRVFWPLCSESWPPQHAAPSDIGTICAKLRVLASSMQLHAILNQPRPVLLGHFDSRPEWQKKIPRAALVLHAWS